MTAPWAATPGHPAMLGDVPVMVLELYESDGVPRAAVLRPYGRTWHVGVRVLTEPRK